MGTSATQERVFQEVKLIPEDKLDDVYAILHYFRLGVEASQGKPTSVMQYAGCWQDMPAEVFAEFTREVVNRRQQAFSRRRNGETHAD